MSDYIQDPKTGQMKGRLGDGRSNIPPHDELPAVETEENTVELKDYSLMYDTFSKSTAPHPFPSLFDIIDREEYESAIAAGHIRTQVHPELPLLIHNYTESCTWEDGWNEATLTCRGLITSMETGEVVARAYKKFFNHGQAQAAQFALDEEVIVMDKADGSLGIGYFRPDGRYALATRGSFASDQANWATRKYASTYADSFQPNPEWTYLFECVYRENRIVLSYDFEDLIMLGAVDIRTGRNIHIDEASQGWNGPTIEVFPHTTLRQALEAPNRENAEGFVIWNPRTDERVKVKQEDYLVLHRLLTGSTTLSVWETLSTGQDPEEHLMDAPDEFQDALKRNVAEFRLAFETKKEEAVAEYHSLHLILDTHYGEHKWGRKEFAEYARRSSDPGIMFLLLDDRDIDDKIWRKLRPVGGQLLMHITATEDS